MELKIGQTIYLEPKNNAARYSKEIKTDVIAFVGRKYFETERNGKFEISTMEQYNGQYVSNYTAYISEQDIVDKKEKESIIYQLKNTSLLNKLTLSNLKEIIELTK